MKKIIIRANGNIIDTKYASDDSASKEAKRIRETYKRMGCDYKVSVAKA